MGHPASWTKSLMTTSLVRTDTARSSRFRDKLGAPLLMEVHHAPCPWFAFALRVQRRRYGRLRRAIRALAPRRRRHLVRAGRRSTALAPAPSTDAPARAR